MDPVRKRKIVVAFQRYALNPVTKLVAGTFPGWVLLETVGRRSSKPRRTPLGGTREGSTYWIVSEQGRHANYVKNIAANAHVRIRINTKWYDGTAHIVDDDDTEERLKKQSMWNRSAVRATGTDLLSIRVDLEDR
ncbi:MAG: nitroreductase/quinone reductase family protein [Actinomycetota bacterium]